MIRLAQRWSICQPVWLDRHRKRLAGGFSASDVKGLEKDLEVAVEGGQKVGHFDGQLRTSKTVAGRGVRGTDARRIAGPVPLLAQRRRTMPAGKTGS
jgi:hypothetical protein